jgi:glycosyltransferase involved in cell wall biosynthesis
MNSGFNKILFVVRKDYLDVPGGDTIQIIKTKEFLEKKYGLEIFICTDKKQIQEYQSAKIIHIFDMREDNLKFINEAKKYNKKIVLSTIYWDLTHSSYINFLIQKFNIFPSSESYYKFKDFIFYISNFRKILTFKTNYYFSKKYKSKRQWALKNSDAILPNSPEEMDIVVKHFGLDLDEIKNKIFIVPNAVNSDLSTMSYDQILPEIAELKDFVLEVARIEPIKNQLNLVKALMDKPEIPIVFIGSLRNKRYKNYFNKLYILSNKRGNVYFIDHIAHETIFDYYKKAKVHVMASFRESTGLSSLEALISGCEIVVASEEYCPINYYEFDKYGHICDPYSPESIKKAVLEAFNKSKNLIKQENYLKKFSYENTADETYKVYLSLMENN